MKPHRRMDRLFVKSMRVSVSLFALVFSASLALASKQEPTPAEIETIIQQFAAKEAEFAKAREAYTYRQTAKIQELDLGGSPSGGKFEIVTDIVFSSDGRRTERVVRAPVTTLQRIQMTPEDEQDLRNVQPFVLTSKDIDKYHVRYLGKERLDEIDCFAFAVKPKKMEAGQRYFQGIIWVDDRDLQIVKSYGRGTGLKKKGFDYQYPKFETYREQIDGKFWFPTYTVADTILPFENGPVRLKLTVRYDDYKQFGADVKITFGEEAPSSDKPATPPAEPKKP
jgi:hypothetical protein